MNAISPRVTLILKDDFTEKILSEEIVGAIWIVDSEQSRPYIKKARMLHPLCSITTFSLKEGESLASACNRIVISLDEHHNEFSQKPGYKELDVIGVSLLDIDKSIFFDLNFNKFVVKVGGFLAKK